MKDYADKDWLRVPPTLNAGDVFVVLCIIGFGGYLLYKTGIWA